MPSDQVLRTDGGALCKVHGECMASRNEFEPVNPSQPSSRPAAGQSEELIGRAPRQADGAARDESPELLRWRAEMLLDEMMLGGVDYSAHPRPVHERDQERAGGRASRRPAGADNGLSDPATGVPPASTAYGPRLPNLSSDSIDSTAGFSDADPQAEVWEQDWRTAAMETPASQGETAVRIGPDSPPAPPSDQALLRPPASAGQSSGAPDAGDRPSNRPRWGERPHSPYLNRQSHLLPRMSQKDVRELRQELNTLQATVEQTLPVEHDWRLRSDHLLEKADRLLRTEPERTAEVEYYLQQVHAILERARQTAQSSSVYLRRLTVYHVAWLLFSLVLLSASILYFQPLTGWLAARFGLPAESVAASLLVPGIATLASALLGTALGALRNMQRYHHRDRGFFDRNYSLRGLLLPVFALLVAAVIYAGFGLVYWLVDLNLIDARPAGVVPALFAFLFGLLQESVYGTAP